MSENRFADCTTVEAVLWKYHELARDGYGSTALTAPASARIRELTPPVVSEEARERARRAARKWWNEPTSVNADALADRIIDALGYTPARGEQLSAMTAEAADDDGYLRVNGFVDTRPAPPPVVTFDANDLQVMRDRLREWERVALDFDVDETHRLRTKVGWIEHDGSAWVLRIGGGDE